MSPLDRNLALAAGFAISFISAWFSIIGLTAIFAGAFWSIVIMGTALEIGKVITASYLYRNWKDLSKPIRAYFGMAVVILMIITSMGTFGYLSRAHIEQTAPTSDTTARIERIDAMIAAERQQIVRAENVLKQLDAAVDSYIARNLPNQGLEARRRQQAERSSLAAEIKEAEKNIDALINEKMPMEQSVRALEREVGPIRYVAEMVYSSSDHEVMERTIRWIIIMLVLVMDPLAILLIMAATKKEDAIKKRNRRYEEEGEKWMQNTTTAVATDGKEWKNMDVVVSHKK